MKRIMIPAFLLIVCSICSTMSFAQVGEFLDFDGSNDAIILPPTAALSQVSEVTIETWVYPNQNDLHTLFDDDGTQGITQSLMWQVRSDGSMSGHYRNFPSGGTHQTRTPAGVIPAGQWTHVALVYDGSQPLGLTRMRLYVNGVDQTTQNIVNGNPGNVTPNMTGNTPPGIGILDNNFASRTWNGKMDEYRIWTTARTATEISSNMNNSLVGNEPGLFAYFPFDQGTCGGNNAGLTTAIDLANGNNGTLTNFALNGCASNWVCGGATCGFPSALQPPLVPTLSQWGLILLGLLVVSMGTIMVWKTRNKGATLTN